MTSIDEVIERSQKPGEFRERREFTVARGQAIKKLRQFALVDRYYCVLELIQSAVANGATYIDVQADRDSLGLSYVGGSFEETSLAQLFDFLFAAQDNVEHGPLRQLALGVNALMDFGPDEIIIETGDGTLEGTTRVIIGDDDTVQVGRPEESLDGTYLRATGLNWGPHRVKQAISERCLVAPVPILYNHDPLFGYSRQRTPPSLFGFQQTVSFDEGDLYGTIGVARRRSGAVFRILTHGVWIESTHHKFTTRGGSEIANLGGVVTFDRLRKTADHSAIVQDGRYEEMWLRLQPYVNQLVSSETEAHSYDVRTLAGDKLENQELLELLRNSETMVLVPPKASHQEEYTQSARAIGESLGVPVLCVGKASLEPVQILGGRDVDFILSNLEDEREIEFYTQREAELPPRPWLTSPADLETMSLVEVVDSLRCPGGEGFPPGVKIEGPDIGDTPRHAVCKAAWLLGAPASAFESLKKWKTDILDPMGESVRAKIYTPEQRAPGTGKYNVEVRAARRTVWQGHDEAIAPGQVLIIDVADLAPKRLWSRPRGGDEPVARLICEAVVSDHLGDVEEAADRGLMAALRADVEPGSNAAQLVLASVTQRLVKRIRPVDSHRRVRFSIVDQKLDAQILDVPLCKTLSGDDVSLRGVEELMQSCHGLLYAVRVDIEADLEGLDRAKILVVDEILEDLLISLVGASAYVRIDERDELAEWNGLVCRDLAVGLREYPQFPLLVEGGDPSKLLEERRQACVQSLLEQLVAVLENESDHGQDQELRRHAWRHLQWFATHRSDFDFADDFAEFIDEMPLYGLTDERTCGLPDIAQAVEVQGHVEMLDGWAVRAGELTFDEAMARRVACEDSWPYVTSDHPEETPEKSGEGLWPFVLQMNPFVLHLLGSSVQGAAEYHLSEREAEAVSTPDVEATAMLERVVVDDDLIQGVVGLPNELVHRPMVIVFDGSKQDVVIREDIGARYGVVGKVRLRSGVESEVLDAALAEAAEDVLSHLLIKLPEMSAGGDEKSYRRALSALLDFASGQVQMIAHADMTVESEVRDRLARRVLNAPLLPGENGFPLSPMAVYREFESRASRALALGEGLEFRPATLADKVDETVENWWAEQFRLQKIHRPGCYTDQLEDDGDGAYESDDARLEATLGYWVNVMHPAGDAGEVPGIEVRVVCDGFVGDLEGRFCQIVGRTSGKGPTLNINRSHKLSRWVIREGEHSQRPIAWALLAAYGHINDVLEEVTGYHEMICQRRVADALEQGKLKMR